MDPETRRRTTERLRFLQAQRAARDRLDEVAAVIREAESDEEAADAIAALLDCDPTSSWGVLTMQLRRLRTQPADVLALEVAELEQKLRDADDASPLRPRDTFVSPEHRYSLGIDDASGAPYASFPVTTGVADYEEFYLLTPEQHARFTADPASALAFVEKARRREHDDLLLQKPGRNRGTPI